MAISPVIGGNDLFGFDAFDVAAGIGDHAVTTQLQGIVFSSIANDAMQLHGLGIRKGVQDAEGGHIRRKGADAVELASAELLVGWGKDAGVFLGDAIVEALKFIRRTRDPCADAADNAVGELTAAMGDGDEDNAMDGAVWLPIFVARSPISFYTASVMIPPLSSLRRSWPQAASMSWPFSRRRVTWAPPARTILRNCS